MKFKFLNVALTSAVLSISIFVNIANAGLIDNGNTTIDTANNLEWLDLSYTEGLSFNEAMSSTFVANENYRLATHDDLLSLYVTVGFNVGSSNYPGEGVLSLFKSLGCTYDVECAENIGWRKTRARYYNGQYSSNIPAYSFTNWFETNGGRHFGGTFKENFWTPADRSHDTKDSNIATLLVRSTIATTVPEPSTLAIFALSMVGLVFRKFKNK